PTPSTAPTPSTDPIRSALPADKAELPTKTLADFAAQVDLPCPDLETTASSAASEVDNFAEKLKTVSTAAEDPQPTDSAHPAVAVQPSPTLRAPRSRFPTIAAFVVGPVVGGILGLYGLLWLQGKQADYLGLASVLPASLLPSDGDEQIAESQPATADSPDALAKAASPNSAVKRDAAVQPAAAHQPVPSGSASVRIDAQEFSELVDAAESAAGEFVEGELSTAAAIKRKGQAYMALCRLAEHFDFAKQLGLAPSIHAKAKQAARLFGQVTFQAQVRRDLAHIAGRWWGYDQRPSQGIFLAGVVQEVEPAESHTLCWVKLSPPSTVAAIPVLLAQPYEPGDQIGVVGSIVADAVSPPPSVAGGKFVRAEYTYALQVSQ
ncbi:MAG: hypothetical protein ACR2NM_04170, partial [Bythopirellula sp.]